MKKIISIVIALMVVVCWPFHALANNIEHNEDADDILLLFMNTMEKIKVFTYADYPLEIVGKPIEYNMRITNPEILDKETQGGTMIASKIDEVRFRSFYSDVFSEEITSLFLETPDYPLSSCGAFKYEGSYYLIPGYVWNLPTLLVGSYIEHCKPLVYGSTDDDIPFDELIIKDNEAQMIVTLWYDSGLSPNSNSTDSKMGTYDLLFSRTVNGWRVSGGSFIDLFFGIKSTDSSPHTGDQFIILISVSALCFCFFIFYVKMHRPFRRKH